MAVTVLVLAGTVYLYATLPSKSTPASLPPPSLGIVVGYAFVTASLGWVLERAGPQATLTEFRLLRTEDGGKHWRQQLRKQGTAGQGAIADGFVRFVDGTVGFTGVMWPQLSEIYRTDDGGVHWVAHALPSTGAGFPIFSDLVRGWLLGLDRSNPDGGLNLYATTDGGSSWQQLPDPPADSVNVTFRGPAEGWLASTALGPPHVYSSEDGGRTWQRHDLPVPPGGVPGGLWTGTAVRLLPGAGVVASVDLSSAGLHYELTSFDRASSWRYVAARPKEPIFGDVLSFQDSFHWWAIDGTALLKSRDAGQTWTQVSNGLPDGLYACQVFDSTHAWALLGSQGSTGLVRSVDSGLHWSQVTIPRWTLPS